MSIKPEVKAVQHDTCSFNPHSLNNSTNQLSTQQLIKMPAGGCFCGNVRYEVQGESGGNVGGVLTILLLLLMECPDPLPLP